MNAGFEFGVVEHGRELALPTVSPASVHAEQHTALVFRCVWPQRGVRQPARDGIIERAEADPCHDAHHAEPLQTCVPSSRRHPSPDGSGEGSLGGRERLARSTRPKRARRAA